MSKPVFHVGEKRILDVIILYILKTFKDWCTHFTDLSCCLIISHNNLRLSVARVLVEATLLCYETNCLPHLRDYVFIVECILIVSIEPKFYNWYIFVLMLWCHWVTPQWTMYVISHLFLFVYIIPCYVFYHIMSLCFRCWCTLSEMTRIKMINQSIIYIAHNRLADRVFRNYIYIYIYTYIYIACLIL